jgi:transcription antitermination factor NusG
MSAPSWAVVMTKPMAEQVAGKNIGVAGFRWYLPMYRKVIRGTRLDERGRRIRPRGEIVLRPLFPGYLFAELHPDQAWSPMKKAVGVSDLIWRGERPALLDAYIVEAIRETERAGLFDEARPGQKRKRADIEIGNQVRVLDGPFASFIGELAALDETGRARALLDLFGRETSIDIDQDSLELVGA